MGDTKEDISLAYAYPLCKVTDMPDDMRTEAMEATVTADLLDKKFGAPFNVVIGEDYSYCCTHQENSMLLMFTNGNVAALIWRTVASFG
ncbi:unnamed protein product [Trichogramma brassicae]|uniref:Uncharacterized protein n=1 Tax=Trichogramma brassicae TaxID=86971 RepID=A0A6H5J378_9HYME|nr:unnamed protein product [Trichogramma brassicae]